MTTVTELRKKLERLENEFGLGCKPVCGVISEDHYNNIDALPLGLDGCEAFDSELIECVYLEGF